MRLDVFNELPAGEAANVLRPCVDVDRWIDTLVSARPFHSLHALSSFALQHVPAFSPGEISAALAHHPRIGERAPGASREADLSRGEQASLKLDGDASERLEAANRAYEQRFNRVFLIRAAGRSTEEILAECERRLGNDEENELREVGEQLRQIAVLRLKDSVQD